MYTLNCKGTVLSIDIPIVMGILNITSDSFYAGSRFMQEDLLLKQAEKMLEEGATILDVGGMSTRPGAAIIPEEEEKQRVIPAIQLLHRHFPEALLSVDTYRTGVADEALSSGASIINDVSGASDEAMLKLAAREKTPYICMHGKGTAQTMQSLADYEDVTTEVLDFFIRTVADCRKLGLADIILDPGFGFAKTIEHNFELLRGLEVFGMLGLPLLVGLSRKATVYRTLGITPEEALNGTTVLHTLALEKGATILRAHDVKEAKESIRLWGSYRRVPNLLNRMVSE
jgi:dihydropteroate synthase